MTDRTSLSSLHHTTLHTANSKSSLNWTLEKSQTNADNVPTVLTRSLKIKSEAIQKCEPSPWNPITIHPMQPIYVTQLCCTYFWVQPVWHLNLWKAKKCPQWRKTKKMHSTLQCRKAKQMLQVEQQTEDTAAHSQMLKSDNEKYTQPVWSSTIFKAILGVKIAGLIIMEVHWCHGAVPWPCVWLCLLSWQQHNCICSIVFVFVFYH